MLPQTAMDGGVSNALGGVFVLQKLRSEKSAGMLIFQTPSPVCVATLTPM
jgi:hypothetical protein